MAQGFSSETELINFINFLIPKLGQGTGIGDDAAVVNTNGKKIVLTTDSLVENIHFKTRWVSPEFLGRKAAVSNLSDIAAMGAWPLYALVSLNLPHNLRSRNFIQKLYRGFDIEFDLTKTKIVGGNITSSEELTITLTLIGEVERPLLRSLARVADLIFCTGFLGSADRELNLLLKGQIKQMEYIAPQRIGFGQILAQENLATACIDVSDGLALDLNRLCQASGVGALLYQNKIPKKSGVNIRHALFGGEDYELLFSAAHKNIDNIILVSQKTKTPIFQIGEIKPRHFGIIISHNGHSRKLPAKGWDHLQK